MAPPVSQDLDRSPTGAPAGAFDPLAAPVERAVPRSAVPADGAPGGHAGAADEAVADAAAAGVATLQVQPRVVVRALVACIAAFVVLHVLGVFSARVLGYNSVFGIVPRFDLNQESTVPTWFTSGILLLSGLLAGVVAQTLHQQGQPGVRRWLLLAAVLAFLSFDETMMVHESLAAWARTARDTAPLRVAVVGTALGGIALVVAAAALSLLRHLPGRIRWLAVAAAAIYLVGAVGVDAVASDVHAASGATLAFDALILLEELGELAGVVLAVHTLLAYLVWLQRRGRAPAWAAAPGSAASPASRVARA